MFTIFVIIVTASATLLLAQQVFCSPKTHIEKLWKEIFVLAREMGKHSGEDSVADSLIKEPFEKAMAKREKMINALLDYYFDPVEDREYIKEKRPEQRNK